MSPSKNSENFRHVWQWYGPNRTYDHQCPLYNLKWYHSTEDEDYIGPFDTEELANEGLYAYSKRVLGTEPLDRES